MRKTRKPVALGLAVALVAAVGIGATVAYLTDKTEAVTNTFTVGNIDIELEESENLDLKMVPGCDIEKDPVVTVKAGSEDCWLFVKVEKSADKAFDDYMTFGIAEGWRALEGVDGVYWRAAKASERFSVLADDKVTVKPGVTKQMMDEIDGAVDGTGLTDEQLKEAQNAEIAKRPTLTFTAYAVQKAGFDDAEKAWTEGLGK